MKKIYLLILLAVSMCFASLNVTRYDNGEIGGLYYTPSFKIKNMGSSPIDGYKIYVYFMTDDIDARPVLTNGSDPSARVESMNDHVYRVVINHSNSRILSGMSTPILANPDILPTFFTVKAQNITTKKKGWYPYPWKGKDIVIESSDGTVLYNVHPDFKSRVGVLVGSASDCASGFAPSITIDVEDKNNKTEVLPESEGAPLGITFVGKKNNKVKFQYCAVSAKKLPRAIYDYVVLKLDSNCPDGTYWFTRHHDAEDSNNDNSYEGAIWPNKVYRDVDLEYCYVLASVNTTTKFPFGIQYGVFANPPSWVSPNIVHSAVYMDDEDHNNENELYYNFNTSSHGGGVVSAIGDIVELEDNGKNTIYRVIRWNPYLSKSAAEIADAPISAEKTLVAAVPHAPAIKGLNRSAVAVELKSEGNVKVSIVNANGSVIANIAQENLQPGVHQIKWNSGMVPSGRYIVKVEQNGMVNAKNVILK